MASSTLVPVKVITWEGTLGIDRVKALKKELLDGLEGAQQLVLSVSMLDSVDLSIIQLIRSAALEARQKGKSFHLTGTFKPELLRVFSIAGFLPGTDDNARAQEALIFGFSPDRTEDK